MKHQADVVLEGGVKGIADQSHHSHIDTSGAPTTVAFNGCLAESVRSQS
jgi:hypothetical protein